MAWSFSLETSVKLAEYCLFLVQVGCSMGTHHATSLQLSWVNGRNGINLLLSGGEIDGCKGVVTWMSHGGNWECGCDWCNSLLTWAHLLLDLLGLSSMSDCAKMGWVSNSCVYGEDVCVCVKYMINEQSSLTLIHYGGPYLLPGDLWTRLAVTRLRADLLGALPSPSTQTATGFVALVS